jgi:hypothetical protein
LPSQIKHLMTKVALPKSDRQRPHLRDDHKT